MGSRQRPSTTKSIPTHTGSPIHPTLPARSPNESPVTRSIRRSSSIILIIIIIISILIIIISIIVSIISIIIIIISSSSSSSTTTSINCMCSCHQKRVQL
jgi:hypothetical protein